MITAIVSLFSRMLAAATPIALGAVGGIFGEKSGISNIGLEGTMVFGAFGAVVGCYYSGSPWIGLLCGAATGILISLLHAYFCITLRIDQSVIGIAINILASSVTVYLSSILFGNKGFSPNVAKLPDISIPLLSKIPVAGLIFQNMSVLTLAACIFPFFMSFLLYKTKFGLHVLASGEAPKAAYVMGIAVKRVQYLAVIIGGFGCGLAGAYLSISYLSQFVRDMVAGRGFIAIAAILFGSYHPIGVMLASLFFGLADALQMSLQGNVTIPNELIQCIPYLCTIAAVSLNQLSGRKSVKTKIKEGSVN